jgi:hypothetical protein
LKPAHRKTGKTKSLETGVDAAVFSETEEIRLAIRA